MIKSISLTNFRLFEKEKFITNNKLVIFSGKNATGKTSVLESIYLCSTSKSHRTNDLKNIIREKNDFAVCEIEENKKYKVVISKEAKSFFIGNKEYKKIGEFIGNLKIIMFSPNDLNLINGSRGERRHFLDLEISLIDKSYLNASTAYKRILKERNELLKSDNVDSILLEVLTNQLIEQIKVINLKRINFLNKINEYLIDISKYLKIEKIYLKYKATYDSENLENSFKQKQAYDIFTKTTNIGTHRDDVDILLDNKNAYEFASEGQKRIICIAIKMALKKLVEEIFKEEPILLLDDVFAALDQTRINLLVEYLKNNQQTFITTTSTIDIPDVLLKDALVIRIEKKRGNE